LAACALLALLGVCEARAEEAPGAEPGAQASLVDTAETPAELVRLATQLGAVDARERANAFATLRALASGALPAIEKRIESIAQRDFELESTLKAMSDLRRVQGIEAADAEVDLARGVLPLLERDRGRGAVLAAELVSLLRALEAQKSLEAAELIVGKLWPLDAKLFRYEAVRTQARLGVLMIPAYLRHRSHARSHVRALCEEGLAQLSITGPGRAVQQDDVALLAAILTAYGDALTFDAMPVVVSYLGDERVEVQRAAQHALSRFGKNAIWQLRERYVNATGKDPDPSWGHQRLRDALLRIYEAPKLSEFDAAMKSAERALEEQKLEAAEAAADSALRVLPASSQAARAVPIYDALARHFEARGELLRALAAISRAERLAPEDPAAPQRRARALWLEAELRLSTGQVDLKSYQRALALDPGLHEASGALDDLTGKSRERARTQRRAIGGAAALLLLLAAVFVLRDKRATKLASAPAPGEESEPGSAALDGVGTSKGEAL
jgi:tetratricopeptide (TPR) repeat protein